MIKKKTVQFVLSLFQVFIILSLLNSCETDLDINEFIDKKSPIILTIKPYDKVIELSEIKQFNIEVNSTKWNEILTFANQNKEKWHSSPASYIGEIYLTQGDFRLIYNKGSESVVISFMDKNGKPKQYVRKIKKGELDFLLD
jgi:hypothetical protein